MGGEDTVLFGAFCGFQMDDVVSILWLESASTRQFSPSQEKIPLQFYVVIKEIFKAFFIGFHQKFPSETPAIDPK